MSRRLNDQTRRLGQRKATRDTAGSHAMALFPTRGQRTQAKVARLVSRYLEGRRKAA